VRLGQRLKHLSRRGAWRKIKARRREGHSSPSTCQRRRISRDQLDQISLSRGAGIVNDLISCSAVDDACDGLPTQPGWRSVADVTPYSFQNVPRELHSQTSVGS
jgi:hypothetical protein